jgi:hypothetical protein
MMICAKNEAIWLRISSGDLSVAIGAVPIVVLSRIVFHRNTQPLQTGGKAVPNVPAVTTAAAFLLNRYNRNRHVA